MAVSARAHDHAICALGLSGKAKNELLSAIPGGHAAAYKVVMDTHAHWEGLVKAHTAGKLPDAAKGFFVTD